MKRTCTNSSTQQSNSSRCTYLSSAGRRCRMPASPNSPYCRSHAKNNIIVASTLAAELSQAAGTLGTPEDVNRVLAKIFLALAEDRLSTRKAAVLGYIGQMLLRSHREIAFHKKLADEEANREADREAEEERIHEINSWTIPRPIRDADPIAPPQQTVAETETPPQAAATQALTSPSPSTPPSANEPNFATALAKTPPFTSPCGEPSQPYPPLPDLNHFYPRDPTLRPGLQQPRNTTVYPDEEELRWRELSRRYAFPRRRM